MNSFFQVFRVFWFYSKPSFESEVMSTIPVSQQREQKDPLNTYVISCDFKVP